MPTKVGIFFEKIFSNSIDLLFLNPCCFVNQLPLFIVMIFLIHSDSDPEK